MLVDSRNEIRLAIAEQHTRYKEDGDTYRCRAAKKWRAFIQEGMGEYVE